MQLKKIFAAAALAAAGLSFGGPAARAADHGDAPGIAHDQGADIADVYNFLDPNDNTQIVFIVTFRGFIVPGEAVNFGIFDPLMRYRIEIENTGDAKPDAFIDVTFNERTSTAEAQTATVRLPFGGPGGRGVTFTAPATNPTLNGTPNEPVVTPEPTTGVQFFAGEVDDPFFFDIPATQRFIASVRAGAPNPAALQRGRDTFAGYNIMSIALRMPVALVKGEGDVVGIDFLTQRRTQTASKTGVPRATGAFRTIDRMGNPGVNVLLIPFARKNAYNGATTIEQSRGAFQDDILSTLQPFGTDQTSIGILAGLAITNGDFVRVDTTRANSGPGGGNNAGTAEAPAGFPNGRRLGDDTVDVALTVINNRQTLGDSVNDNDVPRRDQFPFLAPPQQPRENTPGGVLTEDNTRN